MIPRGLPHSLANLGDVPVSWLTLLWSTADMRSYREYVADQRMQRLGLPEIYGSANPLAFMELQDVQELSSFAVSGVHSEDTNQIVSRGILRGEGAAQD